ncbi:hypothetical protein F0235_02930 [Vibrio splendidus]|uniref:hypothetical protein n=1 Tax=Vibrio splendidus TaxID=29497 RepID=UPI00148DA956|nr:hypothetical protein [Vibrio splendidus]NOI89395.1 hypothetical protein [Vibrio splendidus]
MLHVLDKRKEVIQATQEEYEAWLRESGNGLGCALAVDRIGEVLISTAFLSLDHRTDGYTPEFFETIIFSGNKIKLHNRYPTWEIAKSGHQQLVKKFNATKAV